MNPDPSRADGFEVFKYKSWSWRSWIDDEDRAVLAQEVSDRELARELNRSVDAIRGRRHRLKAARSRKAEQSR